MNRDVDLIGVPGELHRPGDLVPRPRPLDQAVQHATTELLCLLKEDYGLDYPAASTLLGQCIRYDVGNVFDPAYTIVAKLEKALLERL